ncbi:MAG: MogA/MoaB family molybdenum cofactor biosynthesis protein [Phycisphaerales bacterium]|nr:MogA/MoaB family molybdenum cofactor biosynthesis protein [Phycisphaerales bacterium]
MPSASTQQHRAAAHAQPVACAVLTVSDTRTQETDEGGPLIRRMLTEGGHAIIAHAICRDEPVQIARQIDAWIDDARIQVILTTGGTGIARRDTTIEIVAGRITHPLHGFGELFRMLSYEQVGAAAMLSRAVAGLIAKGAGGDAGADGGVDGGGDGGLDTFIFAMPGSTNAIETAMNNLIVSELSHLVWERKK